MSQDPSDPRFIADTVVGRELETIRHEFARCLIGRSMYTQHMGYSLRAAQKWNIHPDPFNIPVHRELKRSATVDYGFVVAYRVRGREWIDVEYATLDEAIKALRDWVRHCWTWTTRTGDGDEFQGAGGAGGAAAAAGGGMGIPTRLADMMSMLHMRLLSLESKVV